MKTITIEELEQLTPGAVTIGRCAPGRYVSERNLRGSHQCSYEGIC